MAAINASLAKTPCTALKGVGSHFAALLQKMGIVSILDLLLHLPLRYQDRTHITAIRDLRLHDYAVIEGQIISSEITGTRRKMLKVYLRDGSGLITLTFFHFYPNQQASMYAGLRLRCFGEVQLGKMGLEMIHPEYQRLFSGAVTPVEETLTPIYPLTAGLSQARLRTTIKLALKLLENQRVLPELLPANLLAELNLPTIQDALIFLHQPPPDISHVVLESGEHPAQCRLAFEELLAHQISLRKLRAKAIVHTAQAFPIPESFIQDFLGTLPFQLTPAQQRVLSEIQQDLMTTHPMMRLVQGDVGSGKTIVAAIAMLQAVANQYQAVFMAPTELLAEQHEKNLRTWFEPLGIKVATLLGKQKKSERKKNLLAIQTGEAPIVVGTHALFQAEVEFHRLGLLVIDEQHRFGVNQRLALHEKGKQTAMFPHQLVMSATPIPRTLAMTLYADLDVSVIDELPPGRTPVVTVVIPNQKRDHVIERISQACQNQRQVYWVCTLIETSDVLDSQAAEDVQQTLLATLPQFKIGIVHGRLKSVEKEEVMRQFKSGTLDVLVATTVVEVGVDVPNASVMVIENAERLGLSQLHQLRGRVGRGATESFCVLLYQQPLSPMAEERLKVMRETTDGFEIARKDLQLRGPGELLGTRQTGELAFRIAELTRDQHLLPKIQQVAEQLLSEEIIAIELVQRWIHKASEYGNV